MSRKVPVYWSELSRLQERLARLVEQAMLGGGELVAGSTAAGWRPPFDLVETAEAFVLFAELPGVRREDLELECDGHSIELCGVRRPQLSGDQAFLRLESSHGRFKRRLELPSPVDDAAIEARFRRGMLEVVLPKRAAPAPAPVAVSVREE